MRLDDIPSVQIRDRPRNLEDLVIRPGRYTELENRKFQQIFRLPIENAVALKLFRLQVGIEVEELILIARPLYYAGRIDPSSYLLGRFAAPLIRKVLQFQAGDFEVYVDPVE